MIMTDKKQYYKRLFLYTSLIIIFIVISGVITYYENRLDEQMNYPLFEHKFLILLINGDAKTLDNFLKKNKQYIPYLFVKQHPHWGGIIALRALEVTIIKRNHEKLEILLRYFLPELSKEYLANLLVMVVYADTSK